MSNKPQKQATAYVYMYDGEVCLAFVCIKLVNSSHICVRVLCVNNYVLPLIMNKTDTRNLLHDCSISIIYSMHNLI